MARLCLNIDPLCGFRERVHAGSSDIASLGVIAEIGGADDLVYTLRPDLPAVQEKEILLIREMVRIPLNLRVPFVDEALKTAVGFSCETVTLVPGKQPGATPSGGLDVLGLGSRMERLIQDIRARGMAVCLLVDANIHQVKSAAKAGADGVELIFTGTDPAKNARDRADQMENLASTALAASKMNLRVLIGRGVHYQNAAALAAMNGVTEIVAGRAVFIRALYTGLESAVRDMVALVH
ncbi:pyridoxine 5'-phosphate synthase [bacterium]|nr:pyridoxine 5'-phosphate synthase [bacterium]